MKLIRLLVACSVTFVALAALPSYAAAPIEKIQSKLDKPKMLCGRFDQTKELAGFRKPLVSDGRFCVVVGKGVLWRTLQPFPNTLRLTRNEIVQLQGERVATRLDASKEPTVRMINSILFSLLAGDLGQLDKLFEINGDINDGNWGVTLKAREPHLAKAIGGVSLAGDAYVKNIVMIDASGDRTSISFSGMTPGETPSNIQEAKSLE